MNIIQLLKCKLFYFNNDNLNNNEIFYVAGSQSLPAPLEAEEEERMIKRLEEDNDFDARQILVERNLRLVVYIAKIKRLNDIIKTIFY